MSIIKVENLSKKYIIGHDKAATGTYRYYSLRESLMHHARGIYQRLRHPLTTNQENTELEEFWALKDINFEIKQGDRVGIIGRNGAGKSTLLKILSRITEPTSGKITMKGRVASLLEVGTGFHPELTGRENIYLNGAILGMTRVEIKKKFDEIVAFAEVEKFLDTPVKRYSSGMYVRLAFAVAAHLEPEILLVDEVLAVGDTQFQKKCLGKMEDVSKEGRTVLFVSHNMAAINQLCNRGILLEQGLITCNHKVNEVICTYRTICNNKPVVINENTAMHDNRYRRGSGDVRYTSIKVFDEHNNETFNIKPHSGIKFHCSYKVIKPVTRLECALGFYSHSYQEKIGEVQKNISEQPLSAGYTGEFILEFSNFILLQGEYILYFWLGANSSNPFDVIDGLLQPLCIKSTSEIFEQKGFVKLNAKLNIIGESSC